MPRAPGGPWALSLLAALALHAAAVALVPPPGATAVSASAGARTPLEVRWIAAVPLHPTAAPAEVRHTAAESLAAAPAPAPARGDVTSAAFVPLAAAAARTPETEAVAGDLSDAAPPREALPMAYVVASADSMSFSLPVPDVALPARATVLRLRLNVDETGRVATPEPLDPDVLEPLVDAVRAAFFGHPLPGVDPAAATQSRWRLEVRFDEGAPNAQWRLWRES